MDSVRVQRMVRTSLTAFSITHSFFFAHANSTDSSNSVSYSSWYENGFAADNLAREQSQAELDRQRGVQGAIGFDTQGYIYESDARKQSVFSSLSLSGVAQNEGPIFRGLIQGQGLMVLTDSRPSFVEVNQAYVGTSSQLSPVQISIGRKLDRWSALDETWQLGIVQPRFRRDFLHPDPVGLTGAFVSYDSSIVHTAVYGSPISIPERGANVEERDGVLVSSSPWVQAPPRQTLVLDKNTEIKYRLDVPPLGQMISKPNAGALVRVGEEQGFWGRAAYAYKPINQILLSYDAVFQLEDNKQYVAATIHPVIVYHHVAAIDFGYEREQWGAWIGGVMDRPREEDQRFPERRTYQRFGNAWAASAGARYGVGFVSYLHQNGGNLSDGGYFASGVGSLFEERYPFQDAFRIGMNLPLTARTELQSHFTYDFGHEGAIWSTMLQVRPAPHWAIVGGGDWIGARRADQNHFFSRYQANSSLHGGVNYVF